MHDVAILGAGDLGGALAHVLARRDIARSIRLIDAAGNIASGKALDVMQAGAIEGFATQVSGSTDVTTAAGATIVVVADRSQRNDSTVDEALLSLKQLSGSAARTIVICAGAIHRELVDRGVRELGFSRERLFGSAPEALASAVKVLVALAVNGSVKDVALTVLGVPPAQVVLPWEDVTIGGIAATRVLDEPTRRRIAARVALLWPPGPYALATAAAEAVACVAGLSRRTISCFVAPDDSSGRRFRAAAWPARLGSGGVVKVEAPPLSVNARVALDNATLL